MRQGDCRHHCGTGADTAVDLESTTEHADPLPHPRQAHPLAGSAFKRLRGRVESLSLIPYLKPDCLFQASQHDAHPAGPGVLAHVGQGLLCDPEEGDLHRVR
jgi:hypothetical protein